MSTLAAAVGGLIAGVVLGILATTLRRRRSPTTDPPSPPTIAAERAELVSKVAHELKNPIMSVKGLAATGMRLYDSMSDDERREFFQLIDAEASRLRTIAEQASTAMKIDAGTLQYDLREEDLGKLVEQVAWRTPVGEHAMVVECDGDLRARIDPVRFAEVLSSLIDNASKFSPPDAPIEIRAYRTPHAEVVVEVADRGPGIPEANREAVFERFASWRPQGYEETPGAGLGLYICRAHLKAHGGRIDIEREPERGSMLRVTLPAGG